MKQKPLAILSKWFCVCSLIYKNGFSCIVSEFRIKVWSVPTKLAWPGIPGLSVKKTGNNKKQRNIYAIWPHWEEEQMSFSDPKSIFGVPTCDFDLNRGLKKCVIKQHCFQCGPVHH